MSGHVRRMVTSGLGQSSSPGGSGRLFGSVGPADIAAAVKESGGPDVDKRKIVVTDPIKTAGAHRVQVRLHPEVSAAVKIDGQAN